MRKILGKKKEQLSDEAKQAIYEMTNAGKSNAYILNYLKKMGYNVDLDSISNIKQRVFYERNEKYQVRKGGGPGGSFKLIEEVTGEMVFLLLKMGMSRKEIKKLYELDGVQVSPSTIDSRCNKYCKDNNIKINFKETARKNILAADVYKLLKEGYSLTEISNMKIERKENNCSDLNDLKSRLNCRMAKMSGNTRVYGGRGTENKSFER